MKKEIYIGYDPREQEAYDVCKYSIESKTTDINIQALVLSHLKSILDRPIENIDGQLWCPISKAPMSTEFAISRFCVPFLNPYGWSLFMDCDMLVQVDIKQLFDLANNKYAVMVVKHKQESGSDTKMDGKIQTYYNKKNWSSVVLWNGAHEANVRLTLDDLNLWPGRDLHAFKWLQEDEIGELPKEWNHLVGVNEPNPNAKIIHYTLGGPWFGEPKYPEDILWTEELNKLNDSRKSLGKHEMLNK